MENSNHQFFYPPPLDFRFPVQITKYEDSSTDSGCMLHWHEQLEFSYMIHGGMEMQVGGEDHWLYRGDAVFINWCEPHRSLRFLDGSVHYVIQVDLQFFSSSPNDIFDEEFIEKLMLYPRRFQRYFLKDQEISNLFSVIVAEYETQKIGWQLAVKAALTGILTLIFRRYTLLSDMACHSAPAGYVRKILVFLAHHYADCQSLDEIALTIGISKNYMCNLFKAHTGDTIIHHINSLRCYKALSLIAEGNSLSEVSEQIGYKDYNYFSRIFKQIIGHSPSYYVRTKIR